MALAQRQSGTNEQVVENLQKALDLHGWTQRQLAENLGISLPTLHRIRTGKTARISHEVAQRLEQLCATEERSSADPIPQASSLTLRKHKLLMDIQGQLGRTAYELVSLAAKVEMLALLDGASTETTTEEHDLPVDRLSKYIHESVAKERNKTLKAQPMDFPPGDQIAK